MTKFKIIEATETMSDWNALVRSSREGTLFSLSEYLSSTGINYRAYFVKKGHEIRAGFCFLVNSDDTQIISDDLVIYSGILFANNAHQKETRKKTERHEITHFVIEFLAERYHSITFQLSPHFEDLRPFLWHNYHSENTNKKFSVNLKYTSFLDIHDLFYKKNLADNNVYQALDKKRQTDIEKAKLNGLTFTDNHIETQAFIALYQQTLLLQDKHVSERYLDRMSSLIDKTCDHGLLKKYAVKNSDHEISYIVIFGIFNNTATYIFGAGNPHIMQRYDATYCLWEAFNHLSHNYGISLIDMEGINSPQRGAYKLDFGGSISPYYHVTYRSV